MIGRNLNKALLVVLLIGIALIAPAMAATPATVTTSWTGDINFNNVNINGTLSAGQTFLATYYLPCTLEQVNQTGDLNLTIKAGANPVTLTLTINGVQTYSGTLAANAIGYTNGSIMSSAGVDMNATYLSINITVSANSTVWTNLTVIADDAVLSGNNFSSSVTETFITTPEVKYGSDDSVVTVKDTITASQTSSFNMTNVTVAISYPSNKISQDVTSRNISNLNISQSKSTSVSYQKRGPYVTDIDKSTGSKYTIKMDLYSPDNYTAKMDFYTSEKPWNKYFTRFSKSNLVVELDGVSVDWEDPSGRIIIDTLTLTKGWHNLTFTYTPTTVPVVVAETPKPLLEQAYFGLPVWVWAIIAIYVAVGLIYYVKRR